MFVLWSAAFGFGLTSLLLGQAHPGNTFGGTSWRAGLAELVAGWAVIGAGLYVWRRPQTRRTGLLLTVAGLAWFLDEWNNPRIGPAFTFGVVASALTPAALAHAVMAYPSGRMSSTIERVAVAGAYTNAFLVLGLLPALYFDPRQQACGLCPTNPLLVDGRPDLFDSLNRWGVRLALVWTIGAAALCIWRLARSSPPLRRAAAPVILGGAAYLLIACWDFAHSLRRGRLGNDHFEYQLWLWQATMLCVIGLGVAWSWMLRRRTRSAMATLVVELGQSSAPGALRDVLARSLKDPHLRLAYPVTDPHRWVDANGTTVDAETADGRVTTVLARHGLTIALLLHRPGLLDDSAVVDEVVAATRLALDQERLRAELLARLEELRTSRARIVATGDAERQRLERNLHDGAQQRLIGLLLTRRLTDGERGADPDRAVVALIDRAEKRLAAAINELRKLAHGIYPAILTDQGIAAAVSALAEHAHIPVAIGSVPRGRFSSSVETGAYFLIAETTGPAATLTSASGVRVSVKHDRARLVVEVVLDGVGDPNDELDVLFIGLADRVGALGGQLRVEHVPDTRITIRAEIPCES
jgi:signal transduction histidine kinase